MINWQVFFQHETRNRKKSVGGRKTLGRNLQENRLRLFHKMERFQGVYAVRLCLNVEWLGLSYYNCEYFMNNHC